MFCTNISPNDYPIPGRLERCAGCFLFLVLALTFLLLFQDYGVTWDEKVQFEYGVRALRYYTSGFTDQSCNSYYDLYLYGPLFEMLCAAVYKLIGGYKYEIHHFLIAVCTLLTLAGIYRLTGFIFRPFARLLTVIILSTMPHFFGHAFFNPKDIPFACTFSWAMVAVSRLLIMENARGKDFCLTGLAIGLALSVRVGGLLLFAFLGAGLLMKLWQRGTSEGSGSRPPVDIGKIGRFAAGLALLTVTAWFVMVFFWPWTHANPFIRPLEAFRNTTAFHSVLPVLFEGRYSLSSQLPWYYLPKSLSITTPPFILAFFAAGLGMFILHQIKSAGDEKSLVIFLVEMWFFFPVLYVICRRPNIYDGIRHFLFILPAMAVIAAAGADGVKIFLSKYVSGPRVITVLVIVMVLQPLGDMVSLHPYQMTYYNFLVGGTNGAEERYETDYWASSYKEGAEWINRRAAEAGEKKIALVVIANEYSLECAAYYLDPRVTVFKVWSKHDRLPPAFDYLMATTRFFAHHRFDFLPVAHVVGRQGAAFTVIRTGPGSVDKDILRDGKI
jgi:hypothetical protein